MSLDPQCKALIKAVNDAGGPPFDATDPLAARAAYRETISFYEHATPDLGGVTNETISGPNDNPLALRIYTPPSGGEHGALVFFHGGGWAVGDLDTHDHVCRYLCGHADIVVIAVDYRLAPEHSFPNAIDDCEFATRWTFDNVARLGIKPDCIGVGGDSAGGNLAAACCFAFRDTALELRHQLLIYPACDFTATHPSMAENGEGYLLTTNAMHQFTNWYLPNADEQRNFRASPQLATSHAGLPSATIITAGYDPLRDEGLCYAETLKEAGVPVESLCYEGMVHGFLRMGGKLDVAVEALDKISATLNSKLARTYDTKATRTQKFNN
ncbi:MAG: alpha/beta hydrolase [Pseudomonadota bacterium]